MEISKAIWESMLDADMNERYWAYLSRNYHKKDRFIKIFLAIMTSGAVASWGFWADFQILWKLLSAVAAIIAIISPILKLDTAIDKMSTIKGKWRKVLSDYEILWLSRMDKSENKIIEEYKIIREKESEIEEDNFPIKKRLISKIQDEVIKSRGISNNN
jgi:hypothetical protein